MSFANDVSYLVDNKIIVLAEHQSTVNPNMPLRCLEYAIRLYEHIQNPRDRYSRTLKKIPVPAFYVSYNGRENLPAQKILRLSDSFINKRHTAYNQALFGRGIAVNFKRRNNRQNCKLRSISGLFVKAERDIPFTKEEETAQKAY